MNLEGALTWAFEFEDQPFRRLPRARDQRRRSAGAECVPHARPARRRQGLRRRATARSPLDDIIAEGCASGPTWGRLPCGAANRVRVLAWHYHDDDVAGPEAQVSLDVGGLGTWSLGAAHEYRVDSEHGNAYTAWLRMGSPQAPDSAQRAALERASQLTESSPAPVVRVDAGHARVPLVLPRQSVVLVELTF